MINIKNKCVEKEVPGFDSQIKIRYWTARELFSYREAITSQDNNKEDKHWFFLALSYTLSDENGNRLYKDISEMDAVLDAPFAYLQEVANLGIELNTNQKKS